MALQCGIVGLPNVGKSTLFNAISNAGAVAANFPFCTIEPNIGIVEVPDERLTLLASFINPERIVPTSVEFVDIAGLVQGASKGEGLGNQFLANIRTVDAIVHVVRCFKDDNIIHVAGQVDPVFDKQVIDHELQLKDLETIEKRMSKAEKMAKSGDSEAKQTWSLLNTLAEALKQGIPVRSVPIEPALVPLVKSWQLLTAKPVLYVANVDESALPEGNNPYVEQLKAAVKEEATAVIPLCIALEAQVAELSHEERPFFLEAYGLQRPGLEQLIKASYKLLDLITYFTAGQQEVRAWTIKQGTKAPGAAGVIHSDFERGFIKAEVIPFEDYNQYKTELACRKAGKIAIEGKEYVVQDGDIIHFRFNV